MGRAQRECEAPAPGSQSPWGRQLKPLLNLRFFCVGAAQSAVRTEDSSPTSDTPEGFAERSGRSPAGRRWSMRSVGPET